MSIRHSAPASAATTPLHATITEGTDGTPERTLVLLHGVFMDSTLWARVLPLLPCGPTIRIDMPSHGDSPDLPQGASLDDHVRAVAATLDHLGVRGAVVTGHSWGGMVALRLAHMRPDLVGGLALSNTPLQRVRGAARAGFHAQRLLLAAGLPPRLYGRLAAGSLLGVAHRVSHPEDVAALARRADRMGRLRLRETIRSVLLEPEDAVEVLRSTQVPWRAVAGEQDYVLNKAVREVLGRDLRLRVARGGHTTPLEDPTAIVEAIHGVQSDLSVVPAEGGYPRGSAITS